MTDNKKHYHSGFDYFTPAPGERQEMHCIACNTLMSVVRNRPILKYKYPASSDETELRDVFTCDHSGSNWHHQVIELRKFQRDIPSKVIGDLLEKEIQDIIISQEPTKDSWARHY